MGNFVKKYGKKFVFDIDFEKDYKKLSELFEENGAEQEYPLIGIMISTAGEFGESPIFETAGCLVNIPSHMVETVKTIMADDEAVKEIKDGKIGFTIYKYEKELKSGKIKTCYSVNFVENETF